MNFFASFFDFYVNWFNHLRWSDFCMIAFETKRHRENDDCHSRLWMSFFMRKILRFSCETCLFSHYDSWNRSFRSIQNRDRIFCEIFFEIHWKRSSFMNEKCCKQWLMNAKMSRKQNENETLNNSRFKRLFFFSFLFKHFLLFIHLFVFFKQSSKTFQVFHHVVCVKIFSFFQHHQIRSLSFEYVENRFRQKEEFQMLSTLF